jgi:hypothetical protein
VSFVLFIVLLLSPERRPQRRRAATQAMARL